jgi:hypothetical protein
MSIGANGYCRIPQSLRIPFHRVRLQINLDKNEPSRLARLPNSKVKNGQAYSF